MLRRFGLIIFILLFLYVLNAFLFPFPKLSVPLGQRPDYGFSFSFENNSWYGLDNKRAFMELLDCCHFSWVRIPFYWDTMVDDGGKLKVDDLIFSIKEAKKRNIKVIIAIGLKTPYYPEFHLPKSILEKMAFGQTIDAKHPVLAELLKVDKEVVETLSPFDNISYWQVENEPLLANINNIKIDPDLISREVDTVRQADKFKRPIILSHVGPAAFDSRWKKLLPILRNGDVLGVNAYFKTQGVYLFSFNIFHKNINIPWPKGFVWPVQSWYLLSPDYLGLRDRLEKRNISLWVLEMQADPYVRTLEDMKKSDFYFKAKDIKEEDRYLRENGVKSIGLWGSSFWLFRESIGDLSWKNSILEVMR